MQQSNFSFKFNFKTIWTDQLTLATALANYVSHELLFLKNNPMWSDVFGHTKIILHFPPPPPILSTSQMLSLELISARGKQQRKYADQRDTHETLPFFFGSNILKPKGKLKCPMYHVPPLKFSVSKMSQNKWKHYNFHVVTIDFAVFNLIQWLPHCHWN